MRATKYRADPLPGDLRLRHILAAPFVLYGMLNIAVFAMLMFGPSGMELDPFWHAPLRFLFQSGS